MNTVFKEKGISGADLSRGMQVCKATGHRIVTLKRFKAIKPLFESIHKVTGLTPNDILGIHPAKVAQLELNLSQAS